MFDVSPACHELGLRASAVLFTDVSIGPSNPSLRDEIVTASKAVQTRLAQRAEIRQLQPVAEIHRILRAVGIRPRKHPPSNQKLLEFAFKNGTLPAINNLVDCYNLVSLLSGCSLGAHDMDRISPPVQLTLLNGNETFIPLGETAATPVAAGEFGYVDGHGHVLCRLDSVQADFSKVTKSSRRVLLIVESVATTSDAERQSSIDQVISRILTHCGGSAELLVADNESFGSSSFLRRLKPRAR